VLNSEPKSITWEEGSLKNLGLPIFRPRQDSENWKSITVLCNSCFQMRFAKVCFRQALRISSAQLHWIVIDPWFPLYCGVSGESTSPKVVLRWSQTIRFQLG
jgi:hypothetical protein